jgi:hypothetical protein
MATDSAHGAHHGFPWGLWSVPEADLNRPPAFYSSADTWLDLPRCGRGTAEAANSNTLSNSAAPRSPASATVRELLRCAVGGRR